MFWSVILITQPFQYFGARRMVSIARNEAKYQMIKLVQSGRTLTEARAIVRAAAMGLDPEYAREKDVQDLMSLEGGLHRLTMTRGQAINFSTVKFKPRPSISKSREEYLAKWATSYKGGVPLNWKRDGNLVRKGPPNKPRPGSSKNKVRRTSVRGADKTLKDFKILINTLSNLQKRHGKGAGHKQLQKAFKSVRTQVKTARG